MGTSDGITTGDWDMVHELAVNIANASFRTERGDEVEGMVESYKMELLSYLDSLSKKYGPLPSILSTRADYIDDITQQVELLHEAYRLAKARGDVRNELYVASSLARLYIKDIRQIQEGEKWLERYREHLDIGDDSDREDCEELDGFLQQMKSSI